MSDLKPGTLCLIVAGCPENIGLVVEIVQKHKAPLQFEAYLIKTISGRNFQQLRDSQTGKLVAGNRNEAITDRYKLRPIVDFREGLISPHHAHSNAPVENLQQVQYNKSVNARQNRTTAQKSVAPFSDSPAAPLENPNGSYPYLVIRICSGVYQRESIAIRQGEASVQIGHHRTHVQHPSPWDSEDGMSPGARQLLLQGVTKAVTRLGFRMCVVWSKENCSFVERNGIINESTEPPSGGVPAPFKLAFDRREPFAPSSRRSYLG